MNGSFSTFLILDSPDGTLHFESDLSKEDRFDDQSSPGNYEYAASLKGQMLTVSLLYTVQLIPEDGNPGRWACTADLRDEFGNQTLGNSFQESLMYPYTFLVCTWAYANMCRISRSGRAA